MTARVVYKARLSGGDTGAITGHRNVRIVHVGIDPDDFPAIWFETDGPANIGQEYDVVDLVSVWTGEWRDLDGFHHVGTYVHRYLVHHVYARISTQQTMGELRTVPA